MACAGIDSSAVVRWADACADTLWRRRAEIDALNVFPVPDSDTGTNIAHTFRAAARTMHGLAGAEDLPDAVLPEGPDRFAPSRLLAALAQGAVDGARGNSGAILSQVLLGLAQTAAEAAQCRSGAAEDVLGAADVATALDRASEQARSAVSMPIEGTVLTVLAQAARAAGREVHGQGGTGSVHGRAGGRRDDAAYRIVEPSDEAERLVRVVRAAADGAFAALGRTTGQLDVLESAGVVDAGGAGLLVVLDCLVETVTGDPVRRPVLAAPPRSGRGRSGAVIATADPGGNGGERQAAAGRGADDYEVMYLLRADGESVAGLRRELERLGESVVIVGDGGGSWSVHVHSPQAGAAVEAGIAAGPIRDVRIGHLGMGRSRQQAVRPGRAVLAVADGRGAADLFAQEGAAVLPTEGEASGEVLLDAVLATGAGEVLVLPNGNVASEDLVVVSAVARRHGRQVLPLPCSAMVQGLASLAVHDPHRPSSDDAYAMAEAAAATRSARVRIARGRALTWAGTCAPGDALGVIGGEVMVVDRRAGDAVITLSDLLLGTGGELVTVLVGAEGDDGLVEALGRHVAARYPAVEMAVYPGGQAGEVLQIGVE